MRSASLGLGLIAVAASLCVTQVRAADAPTGATSIRIADGVLNGATDAGGIMSFKGVPFAEPPVGDARWTPAKPVRPWTGAKDATKAGPACLQRTKMTPQELASVGAVPAATSEDCLTLNVWAPAKADKPLPVMVWIHGGGHTAGFGSLDFYDGTRFARDGVILVSINYRLGLLGYFAHPALSKSADVGAPLGNYGMTDQLEALRWVQRNIKALGGDPANVTVFGESAGAQSTLTLLTVPAAKGLFARAIVESSYIGGEFPALATAEATGSNIATALNLKGADATAAELRGVSGEALIAAQGHMELGPIVDGRLLPSRPSDVIAAGAALGVPVLIGSNSDEGSVNGGKAEGALKLAPVDLVDAARSHYGLSADKDALLARKLWGDWTFTAPTRWAARTLAAHGSTVYRYRFDYTPERLRTTWTGVPHGYEVPFVFDSLWKTPLYAALLTAQDKAAITYTHSCWVAFAKTGTPTCASGPAWTPVTKDSDVVMDITATPTLKTDLDKPLLDRIEKGVIATGRLKP